MPKCKAIVISDNKPIAIEFRCPACNCSHRIALYSNGGTPQYYWNGDLHKPTISPSIVFYARPRCHSIIREGKIEFLNDCQHELKGQIIDLPNWEQ